MIERNLYIQFSGFKFKYTSVEAATALEPGCLNRSFTDQVMVTDKGVKQDSLVQS